jgi:hypothetical protein
MDKRVAQASTEVLILMGFLFFVFIAFLVFVNERMASDNSGRESAVLKDTAEQIQNEIRLAYSAKEGYSRNFTVPDKIDSKTEYSISVINNSLILNTSEYQHVAAIPSITGAVAKGNNQIRKANDSIIVN